MKHLAGHALKRAAQQVPLLAFAYLDLFQRLQVLADDLPLQLEALGSQPALEFVDVCESQEGAEDVPPDGSIPLMEDGPGVHDPQGLIYRGVGPMDYYVPAYVGLVMASIGVIGLPVHLAAYRERGVLRRLRASSLSVWTVFGSQLAVSFVIAAIGALLLIASALAAYHIDLPRSLLLWLPAFVASIASFTALGVLLGALLPTARAAQGVGLLLFFVMFLLSGAGPPREVMTAEVMQRVGDAMPLTHVTVLLQDPWLGFGWNMAEFGIVAGIAIVCAVLSWRFFRWE